MDQKGCRLRWPTAQSPPPGSRDGPNDFRDGSCPGWGTGWFAAAFRCPGFAGYLRWRMDRQEPMAYLRPTGRGMESEGSNGP